MKLNISYENENENFHNLTNLYLDKIESFNDFTKYITKDIAHKYNPRKNHLEIFYEDDWIKLIDLKSFYFFSSHNIHLKKEISIRIIENEISKNDDFDIDGGKFIHGKIEDSIRPTENIYDRNSNIFVFNILILDVEKFCSFCSQSSKDYYILMKLGPFYGPYMDNNQEHYVHELCGLWSPNVFIDSNGKLRKVVEEIKRSQKVTCKYCGNKGGGLGCNFINKGCNNTYHILCAKSLNCYFDERNYLIYCRDHIHKVNKHYLEEENYIQENNIETNDACNVCMSGLDEHVLLICEKCNESVHTYCNIPILTSIPEGDFYCKKCLG